MGARKEGRRHETTVGGVTAWAFEWLPVHHGQVFNQVNASVSPGEPCIYTVEVTELGSIFLERGANVGAVAPERVINSAAVARVLAAVLQEAAEIAETREAREGV